MLVAAVEVLGTIQALPSYQYTAPVTVRPQVKAQMQTLPVKSYRITCHSGPHLLVAGMLCDKPLCTTTTTTTVTITTTSTARVLVWSCLALHSRQA